MRLQGLFVVLFGISLVCAASTAQGTDWSRLRGVNFIPSYARSSEEMWEKYDPVVIDRELGFVADLGLNSVRVFLHYLAYRENPAATVAAFGNFLQLSARHHLTVMPILFDSCGIDRRPDVVEMSSEAAYRRFLADPALPAEARQRLQRVYGEYALGRGKAVPVPVGRTTPIDILIWGWWTPSPGLERLGQAHWRDVEAYVDAIVGPFANHPQIISWEIMNEPGTLMDLPGGMARAEAEDRLDKFLAHFSEYWRRRYPGTPVTLGPENLDRLKATEPYVDLLSLHVYHSAEETEEIIRTAQGYARERGKPLVITECLANTNNWLTIFGEEKLSTDEAQLAHYQKFLPILLASRVGWYSWGFITGHLFGGFVDIIHANGYRRPAATYLEEALRGGSQ